MWREPADNLKQNFDVGYNCREMGSWQGSSCDTTREHALVGGAASRDSQNSSSIIKRNTQNSIMCAYCISPVNNIMGEDAYTKSAS